MYMNYKRIYFDIIDKRKQKPLRENEYGERHHIVPLSLGGNDDEGNLVRLSAREHFICHALLSEMYEEGTNEWYKMNHAFLMMKSESMFHNGNRYFNSRLYELKRKDFSKTQSWAQSGQNNSQYGTKWVYNTNTGESKRIKKSEPIPFGWVTGRNRHRKTKEEIDQERINKAIRKANKLFDEFMESDYNSVSQWVNSGSVSHSQQYLSKLWLRYIPDRYKTDSKTQTIKNVKKLENMGV